jgi:3',5'-nucleoside bisphosphate phosphatase
MIKLSKRGVLMNFSKGDFHIHSVNSDGSLEVEELVEIYIKKGFDIIALTDHDTVNGCKKAVEYGKSRGLKVIPGIELSTKYNKENVHILGYFNDEDYLSSELIEFTNNMREKREERCKKICFNLKEYFNIEIDFKKILKDSEGSVGRPHIAKAIIEAGYADNWDYVFEKFIGDHSPAYIPSSDLTPDKAVNLLEKFNAVTVLAHPVYLKNSKVGDLIERFKFDGIEAIYHDNTEDETKKFKLIARQYNLLITAGSDFHSISHDGYNSIGNVWLDKKNIEKFIEKLEKKYI